MGGVTRAPAFSNRPRRRRRRLSPLSPQATFLVISHATRGAPHADAHRFEKVRAYVCARLPPLRCIRRLAHPFLASRRQISNIVKAFKLSCAKSKAQLRGLRAGNDACTVFLDSFTSHTIAMVVTSGDAATDEATLLNLSIAKPVFERLIADLV